jgi:cyclohexa-1,5-dienecarbonyl-CoA hydratase
MISTEKIDRVLHLKINIPTLNVIDIETCNQLADNLKKAAQDPSLSCVMISGEGKCFSAGASVEDHEETKARDMISAFVNACRAILEHPVPVVALVHGFCFGGGLELVMYCDFVVADPDSKFGVPEIKLAFFPPFACSILEGIVGRQNASYLIYTGDTISASDSHRMGLVQRVLAQPEWNQMTSQFNGLSNPVLRLAKKALKLGQKTAVEEAFDAIANDLFINDLYKIEDVREGIASFREKRKAQWKHE